jgi:hypothetical protein
MEFMQLKLRNGVACIAVREGDYYFSYFLWFGDSVVSGTSLLLTTNCNIHISDIKFYNIVSNISYRFLYKIKMQYLLYLLVL